MWESVLKMEQFEIQMNSDNKAVQFHIPQPADAAFPKELELSHSELFELMHTFLSINRTFNQEEMDYDPSY